jgi:hypothetical protein
VYSVSIYRYFGKANINAITRQLPDGTPDHAAHGVGTVLVNSLGKTFCYKNENEKKNQEGYFKKRKRTTPRFVTARCGARTHILLLRIFCSTHNLLSVVLKLLLSSGGYEKHPLTFSSPHITYCYTEM